MTDSSAAFEVAEPDRQKLVALLAGEGDRLVAVRTEVGEIELPEPASHAVRLLLEELGSGASVHLVASDAELTTQQAADILGLSRTYLIRLINGERIPAYLVGTHRRLRASDVFAYKNRREARLAAVDAIANADSEVGVEYR